MKEVEKCPVIRSFLHNTLEYETGKNNIRARIHKFAKTLMGHLIILGASMLTWNMLHTEDPQVLGTTAQNAVTPTT